MNLRGFEIEELKIVRNTTETGRNRLACVDSINSSYREKKIDIERERDTDYEAVRGMDIKTVMEEIDR